MTYFRMIRNWDSLINPFNLQFLDAGVCDFTSFCSAKTEIEDKVRTIYQCRLEKEPGGLAIEVTGNGFLYNMVRIIAGTLIRVGLGVYPPEHVEEILKARNRYAAGETAPAKGLFLKEILY